MPVYTFADLMTPETAATIRQRIVDRLVADGVPVSSWAPSETGGVENLRLDMVANGMQALAAQRIAQAVNGRILPLAVKTAAAEATPGVATALLKKLGRDFYKLPIRDATYTIQNMRFSTVGTPSGYTFAPGELWVRSDATGNKYTNIEGGQLEPGGSLDLPCQAENPGSSYDDTAGTVTTMVTARAGVVCTNVAPADFTAARSLMGSSGTFTASFSVPGQPPPFTSMRIQILTGGDLGSATFQYSTDGGLTWSFAGTVGTSWLLAGSVVVHFSNGMSPSFLAGDVLTAFVGDAILQRGADAETPDAFGLRCRYRYRSLADAPSEDKIALWTFQASQEVVRIWCDADPTTPGVTLVTIASASGPASPQAQIDVEDYIAALLNAYQDVIPAPGMGPLRELARVTTAVAHAFQPTGWAYVPRARMVAAQRAAQLAWGAYLRSIPLGGRRGAVVRAAKLEQILSDAGAKDVVSLALVDLAGTWQDIDLARGEVAQMASGKTLLNTIGWVAT